MSLMSFGACGAAAGIVAVCCCCCGCGGGCCGYLVVCSCPSSGSCCCCGCGCGCGCCGCCCCCCCCCCCRPRHVMSCHVMSCHVMSCHVTSCHVMSCHVMSCHVMSCHVMSRNSMSGQGSSNHVMSCLLSRFLSYLGPSWALCWPFGPILGAHLGAYVGVLWAKKRFQNTIDEKSAKNGLKTLSPAACGAPRHAPGSPGGPKNGPFLAFSKTSVVDVPTCIKNASKKSTRNPFHAATSETSRFLDPPWPMLARLGGHVGPSWRLRWRHVGPCCRKRQKRKKTV